jgi:hypothetical protein
MRYALSEHEWTTIKPMLPNKPRGVPRVDDRRILNGILAHRGAICRTVTGRIQLVTTGSFAGGELVYGIKLSTRWPPLPMRRCRLSTRRSFACTSKGHASRTIDNSRWAVREVDSRARFTPLWMPMVCHCDSPSQPARRTTIGYAQYYSKECGRERCCWQIEDMTPTGSGPSSVNKAHGQIFRRNAIAARRSASVPICTAHVI